MRVLFKIIYLVLFLPLLFVTGCSSDKIASNNDEVYAHQYEAMLILRELGDNIEQYNLSGMSLGDALLKGVKEISENPKVKEAYPFDSNYAHITMNTGIKTKLTLLPVDENGMALFRGGPSKDGARFSKILEENIGECKGVENKTVLVYHPFVDLVSWAQLSGKEELEQYKKDGVIDDYKIVLHEKCTYDIIKTFKDYGLVVISTHGHPDGFSFQESGSKPEFEEWMKSEDEMVEHLKQTQDQLLTDQIKLGLMYLEMTKPYVPSEGLPQMWEEDGYRPGYSLGINSPLISQWDLSNTIVAGMFCNSGYESRQGLHPEVIPVAKAFEEANTRTYYGFQYLSGVSQTVDDEFARSCERTLYNNLFGEKDSTGIAHLNENGEEFSDEASFKYYKNRPRNYFRLVNGSEEYCFEGCGVTLTDKRDGEKYKTVCIGDQTWMAQDLKYNIGNSWCYDNKQINCDSIGRIYDWESAFNACPEGWHLPSKSEWDTLIINLGGMNVAGGKMKTISGWNSPNIGANNSSNFNSKSAGWYNPTNGFNNLGLNTLYWTSSEVDSKTVYGLMLSNSTEAVYFTQFAEKTSGYSCRCVKDKRE